jgi:hypothetical protein
MCSVRIIGDRESGTQVSLKKDGDHGVSQSHYDRKRGRRLMVHHFG